MIQESKVSVIGVGSGNITKTIIREVVVFLIRNGPGNLSEIGKSELIWAAADNFTKTVIGSLSLPYQDRKIVIWN